MLIEENKTDETLSLTAYRAGAIEAGGKTYTTPIIWRNGKIEAMNVQTPSELTVADLFQTTSDLDDLPEVIIIGTGEKQQFLHPKIAAELDKSALPGPRWLAQRIGYGAYLTSAALLCMGGPRGASGKECIQGV